MAQVGGNAPCDRQGEEASPDIGSQTMISVTEARWPIDCAMHGGSGNSDVKVSAEALQTNAVALSCEIDSRPSGRYLEVEAHDVMSWRAHIALLAGVDTWHVSTTRKKDTNMLVAAMHITKKLPGGEGIVTRMQLWEAGGEIASDLCRLAEQKTGAKADYLSSITRKLARISALNDTLAASSVDARLVQPIFDRTRSWVRKYITDRTDVANADLLSAIEKLEPIAKGGFHDESCTMASQACCAASPSSSKGERTPLLWQICFPSVPTR